MRAPRLSVAAKLAPLALTGVAITQLVLAHTTPLTPWKGGGFGMFSRTDSESNRFVHAVGVTRDGEHVRVELDFDRGPRVLPHELGRRVRALPGEAELQRIARRVLSRPLVTKPGTKAVVRFARPGEATDGPGRVVLRSVTVGVFKRGLDRDMRQLVAEPVGTPVVREHAL